MKDKLYLFDSNGTLSVARRPIRGELAEVLTELANRHKVAVVTGSPWHDMEEQLPKELLANPGTDVWCSMGNILYRCGEKVFETDNEISPEFFEPILLDLLESCPHQFRVSFPRHIEYNQHSINFTMLGRPEEGEPSLEIRNEYAAWDEEVGQRRWVIDFLNKLYPEYNISLGGQISVDIVKKGFDKAQVVANYQEDYDITFFGDRLYRMGNDNSIGHVLADVGATIYAVHDPEETLEVLKSLLEMEAR